MYIYFETYSNDRYMVENDKDSRNDTSIIVPITYTCAREAVRRVKGKNINNGLEYRRCFPFFLLLGRFFFLSFFLRALYSILFVSAESFLKHNVSALWTITRVQR